MAHKERLVLTGTRFNVYEMQLPGDLSLIHI